MNTTTSNREMVLFRSLFIVGLLCWLTPSVLLAQTEDRSDPAMLYGVWLMDADVQMQKSVMATRNSKKPLNEKQEGYRLESIKSRVYVFHENGNFEASWVSRGGTNIVSGIWEISKDGILQLTTEDNKTSLAYSISQNKNRLVLTPEITGPQSLHLKRMEL
ncbi:hypothetical protein J2X69_003318 [Algoriphagus sp. 4150]|uniref:hypothetical protein n=1 Tax=Algoriphagus sp. 4150 TaxID=2817756 RepID=UPI00285EC9FF|nr:hypothetical protein [Algoriphagus sp. 4150]MDR7130959.1 hypothetical protein [Algoriphagus sp. 4150]